MFLFKKSFLEDTFLLNFLVSFRTSISESYLKEVLSSLDHSGESSSRCSTTKVKPFRDPIFDFEMGSLNEARESMNGNSDDKIPLFNAAQLLIEKLTHLACK